MEENTVVLMLPVDQVWTRDEDGKVILTEAAKQESLRMYYRGRLAYETQDRRHPIGRYNEHGEVLPFSSWVRTSVVANVPNQ